MEGLKLINNEELQKNEEAQTSAESNPAQTEAERIISSILAEQMDPKNIQAIINEKMTVERSSERN